MTKLVSEIFAEVKKAKTKNERIEILKQHKNRTVIRDLLIVAHDMSVNVLVPDSNPPYKESVEPAGMAAPLDSFVRMFKIFIEGKGYDHLKPMKRESKFIEICESVYKEDAKIFIDAFTRKLTLPTIGPDEIKEIWGYEVKEPRKKSSQKSKKTKNDVETLDVDVAVGALQDKVHTDVDTPKKRTTARRKKDEDNGQDEEQTNQS